MGTKRTSDWLNRVSIEPAEGRILNGVARLLVGYRLLQDVGGEHIADIVRAVRKGPLDGAAAGIGVVDPIALSPEAPSIGILVVRCIPARCLFGLDEQGAGFGCVLHQHAPVPIEIGFALGIKLAEVEQNQPERFAAEEGRGGIPEAHRRVEHLPALIALAALHLGHSPRRPRPAVCRAAWVAREPAAQYRESEGVSIACVRGTVSAGCRIKYKITHKFVYFRSYIQLFLLLRTHRGSKGLKGVVPKGMEAAWLGRRAF